MDLRKCILKKTQSVLNDSFGNISNISLYESAAEETDNSIYYSFVDESTSKPVETALLDVSNEADFSSGSHSSDVDKENTIIERETGIRIIIQAPTPRNSNVSINETISVSPKAAANASPKNTVIEISPSEPEKTQFDSTKTEVESEKKEFISTDEPATVESKTEEVAFVGEEKPESLGHPPILTMEDAMIVDRETISPMPSVDIIVEDVNGDKINPFTSPDRVGLEEMMPVPEKKSPVVVKRSTRRSSIALKTKPRLYSPILRKSLDRKTKAASKLVSNPRRTVYEPPTKSASKPTGKTPTRIPKPAPKAVFKPKTLKCPVSGCTSEFSTAKALVDHQKTHKPTTATQGFPCKWCDKKFQLETALFNHQTEKCTKIPVVEKRKVLDQQDKKEKVRRRTTLFAAPMMTKKKSPRKLKGNETLNKSAANKSMNKSGVLITPKKSLKCHICKEIIPDAIGLANHILGHKFEKLKQGGDKETA